MVRQVESTWYVPFSQALKITYPNGLMHLIFTAAISINDRISQIVQFCAMTVKPTLAPNRLSSSAGGQRRQMQSVLALQGNSLQSIDLLIIDDLIHTVAPAGTIPTAGSVNHFLSKQNLFG